MNFNWFAFISFSIGLAAITGWVRFSKINPAYYPFIYCIWLASVNEAVSYWLVSHGFTTAINNNIYVLLEAVLFIWLFSNWQAFSPAKKITPVLISALILPSAFLTMVLL